MSAQVLVSVAPGAAAWQESATLLSQTTRSQTLKTCPALAWLKGFPGAVWRRRATKHGAWLRKCYP